MNTLAQFVAWVLFVVVVGAALGAALDVWFWYQRRRRW